MPYVFQVPQIFKNFNTGSDALLLAKSGKTDLILLRRNKYYNFLYRGICMLDDCSITVTPGVSSNMMQ
jgi:hypothetical protein